MERSLDRSGEIGAARSYEGCLTASENTRIAAIIREGKAALGIELGSTRVKAVAVDKDLRVIASGSAQWENSFVNGYWSYSEEEIFSALRASYSALKRDIESRYGVTPRTFACMGISAMMHGYLAFDKNDRLLVPFRTWRNVTAACASEILGKALGEHIPERWSIAHLYQAALDKESHVKDIASMNTLAGYVHYRLTGSKVLGVGDASGMFPTSGLAYDRKAAETAEAMLSAEGVNVKINEIFPKILTAGDIAGRLTEAGAALLDESGALEAGIPFCPPEGDAMIVLDNKLRSFHKEIDAVATPSGDPVAMIHCNNCCGDIDDWFSVFREAVALYTDKEISDDELYGKMLALSDEAEDHGYFQLSFGRKHCRSHARNARRIPQRRQTFHVAVVRKILALFRSRHTQYRHGGPAFRKYKRGQHRCARRILQVGARLARFVFSPRRADMRLRHRRRRRSMGYGGARGLRRKRKTQNPSRLSRRKSLRFP